MIPDNILTRGLNSKAFSSLISWVAHLFNIHCRFTLGCSDFYSFFISMAFHLLVVRLGPHELNKCLKK
jgi:hypothetical protein